MLRSDWDSQIPASGPGMLPFFTRPSPSRSDGWSLGTRLVCHVDHHERGVVVGVLPTVRYSEHCHVTVHFMQAAVSAIWN